MATFDGIDPNPTEDNVEAGLVAYRVERCDCIIGWPGSPLDGAKAIRLRVTHDLPLEVYDDNINGGDKINNDMPPMLALPTTAGTGSEVGRSTVISLKATDRKTVIFSPYLMPNYAVCDPVLTAGMPPRITAATGMDALTHNLEAYLAIPYHPSADALALYGLQLCAKSLRRAVEHGDDLNARADMMMAAIMGATAFQKGLGLRTRWRIRSLPSAKCITARPTRCCCPTSWSSTKRRVGKSILTLPRGSTCRPTPNPSKEWVRDLNAAVGIPDKLRTFGITAEMIPPMVEKAMLDGCHLNNPRPCTAEDMRALYAAAL